MVEKIMAKNFKVVDGSRGKAPRFAITCGLQEGYGSSAKTHGVDAVVDLVEAHLKKCAAEGRSFLTGSVTTGEVVYAWVKGPGAAGSGHESQATFSGEVNPLYNASMSALDIEDFLNELACELGSALGQARIYIAFDGDLWILQQEDSETPTGETV
jgi:hypothetical protein